MPNIRTENRPHKNGAPSWQYRIEIASVNGHRKYLSKSGFKCKKDARKAGEAAFLAYKNTGIRRPQNQISVSDFCDLWIEQDIKFTLKETSVVNYQKKIRLYIKPAIGKYYLQDVEKPLLQQFLYDLYQQKKLSRNTLVNIRSLLSKSFRWAEDNKYIVRSPAVGLKIPRYESNGNEHRQNDFIPENIMQCIFEHFPVDNDNHIPLMLGYKCGLREGEVFALCWEDVDFKKSTLSITKQLQWHTSPDKTEEEKKQNNGKSERNSGGYWYFTDPKAGSSRIIDLDSSLLCLLKDEFDKQKHNKARCEEYYIRCYEGENRALNYEKGIEVFPICRKADGKFIHPRSLQYVSKIIHRKLNYPQFTFHSLRHTHATMLYMQGVPDKYIQHRLGHKNLNITKNVYIDMNERIAEQGKKILEDMF